MSITEAASTGDRRQTLLAMRDKLAKDMDEAPPSVVAQIAGRLSAILAEIDGLAGPGEVSSLDELDQRRQNRIAATTDLPPAKPARRQRRK
jgi:hypothetical protein